MYYSSMDDVYEILWRCSSRPSLVSASFFLFWSFFLKLTTHPTFFLILLKDHSVQVLMRSDIFWWLFHSKHVKHRQLSVRSPRWLCAKDGRWVPDGFLQVSFKWFALLQGRSVFHSIRHRWCSFEDVWSSPCFVREARRASRRQSDF